MKILIEAINTPNIWKLSGSTAQLRIYADQTFLTSLGQWIPQGTPGSQNTLYLAVDCSIDAGQLLIPGFEIDSTVDALVNPHATYTAEIVTANKRVSFLRNFAINTAPEGDPSTTWGEVIILRNAFNPQTISDSLIRQLLSYIQLAVGDLNRASETNTGVVAITANGPDPTFPIAVSAHDPTWLTLQGGGGLITEADSALLANGRVTVDNATVQAESLIIVTSMSTDVTGALRVENIVPGASFDIVSSNLFGDNGQVAWIMINP